MPRGDEAMKDKCLLLAASLLFDPQPASAADSIGPSGDFLGADALRLHCSGIPFDVFPDHDCHVCRRKPVALCLGDDALCELASMLFSRLMLRSGRRPLLSYSGTEAARDPNGVEPRIPGRTVPGGCHAEAREARQGSVALPSSTGSGKARKAPGPGVSVGPERGMAEDQEPGLWPWWLGPNHPESRWTTLFVLVPPKGQTLKHLAEGEYPTELDWVALHRLKRWGFAKEQSTGRGVKITPEGLRILKSPEAKSGER